MARRTPRRTLSRDLYEQLIERNLESFDWINGGQTGPIKFIDLDQFEFAISRARKGSLVATLMINLTLDGIGQLIVPEHGGACQYSTGPTWNRRNQLITLAGQAIVLQTLALGASLRRRKAEFKMGCHINAFVEANAREIGLLSLCENQVEPDLSTGTQLRDNLWYAIALNQFGNAYNSRKLISAARQLFESVSIIKTTDLEPRVDHTVVGPAFKLERIVATAEALAHFGITTTKPKLLQRAISVICSFARRYADPQGGFTQVYGTQPSTEALIDIDCTIDLVRTCLALLRIIPDHRLWSITRHGLSALFDPAVALARRPETGILLIATELEQVRAYDTATADET